MIYKTYEEALNNLPETKTFTNERPMYLKKNIGIKNLFFVPFENTYYLEEISLNGEITYIAYDYFGKSKGYAFFTSFAVPSRAVKKIEYIVDEIPAEYMYDDLPKEHPYNTEIHSERFKVIWEKDFELVSPATNSNFKKIAWKKGDKINVN